MAAFYLDHNVPQFAVFHLHQLGHSATTARAQAYSRENDAEQLRLAARNGWTLVTRNRNDFELLHSAWIAWAQEWAVTPTPQHTGIVVIPDRWLAERVAIELDHFVQLKPVLANNLYIWQTNHGWVHRG